MLNGFRSTPSNPASGGLMNRAHAVCCACKYLAALSASSKSCQSLFSLHRTPLDGLLLLYRAVMAAANVLVVVLALLQLAIPGRAAAVGSWRPGRATFYGTASRQGGWPLPWTSRGPWTALALGPADLLLLRGSWAGLQGSWASTEPRRDRRRRPPTRPPAHPPTPPARLCRTPGASTRGAAAMATSIRRAGWGAV